MLNLNNTGIVQYKTVKVATLDSITQIVFFTHEMPPPIMLAQGHKVSFSDCRWRCCTPLVIFTDKEKAQYVLWSHIPRDILVFFQ
jgi:hypothetical protein